MVALPRSATASHRTSYPTWKLTNTSTSAIAPFASSNTASCGSSTPSATRLVGFAAWRLKAGKMRAAAIAGVIGALLVVWYVTTDTVPLELVVATPYVATLLVLSVSSQRLRMPKANGKPYRKGQGK